MKYFPSRKHEGGVRKKGAVVDTGEPPKLATSGIVLQVHELRHPALSVAAQGLISIDKKGPMIQYKKKCQIGYSANFLVVPLRAL